MLGLALGLGTISGSYFQQPSDQQHIILLRVRAILLQEWRYRIPGRCSVPDQALRGILNITFGLDLCVAFWCFTQRTHKIWVDPGSVSAVQVLQPAPCTHVRLQHYKTKQ
jgi:hypothetical protein